MSMALIMLEGLIAGVESNSSIPIQISELKALQRFIESELKAAPAQVAPATIKEIHSAVLALQVHPGVTKPEKVAFLAGVHRAAAVVSQFAKGENSCSAGHAAEDPQAALFLQRHLNAMRETIANDAHAASFHSMEQYRAALLAAFDGGQAAPHIPPQATQVGPDTYACQADDDETTQRLLAAARGVPL